MKKVKPILVVVVGATVLALGIPLVVLTGSILLEPPALGEESRSER